MWLTKLKIAIVQKDTDLLNTLLEDIPKLQDAQEIESALYLLREATELMHILKDETENSMKQLKKNLTYLRSTEVKPSSKLDIRS